MKQRLARSLFRRRITYASIALLLLLNGVSFMHAYRFTHFSDLRTPRSEVATDLSWSQKVEMLFTGIRNPRPRNAATPSVPYQTFTLQGTAALESWRIEADQPRGTVVLFHGYAGKKAELLPVAEGFQQLGYRTILVDFPGSGGSEGNDTTVGYREAQDVQVVYHYAREQFPEDDIILYGFSMGSAAILRAVSEYGIAPDALILGCPFSTLYATVQHRFQMLGVPPFPFAALLTFWGGVQHGYWAFGHNPVDYAGQVTIPTLLLYGQQDQRVTLAETEHIYHALAGPKRLEVFEQADHELYVAHDPTWWRAVVSSFLQADHRPSSR